MKMKKQKTQTRPQEPLTLKDEVMHGIKAIHDSDESVVSELWKEMKEMWSENEQVRKDLVCMDIDMEGFRISDQENVTIEFDEALIDKDRKIKNKKKKNVTMRRVRSLLKENKLFSKKKKTSKNKGIQDKTANEKSKTTNKEPLKQKQNTPKYYSQHQNKSFLAESDSGSVSSYKTLTRSRSRNHSLIQSHEYTKSRRNTPRNRNWNLRDQFIPESLTISYDMS